MKIIYFTDTIFCKENFHSAYIKKDTITVHFNDGDPLVKKFDNEKAAKKAMSALHIDLNNSFDEEKSFKKVLAAYSND